MCLLFCHSSNHVPDIEILTVIFFFFLSPPPFCNSIRNSDVTTRSRHRWTGGLIRCHLQGCPNPFRIKGNALRKHKLKGWKPWAKMGAVPNFISSAEPTIMGEERVRMRPREGCLSKENLDETQIFAFLARHPGDLSFNLGTFDTSEIASRSKIKPGEVGFGA